jgi:hypothetical protein
MRNSPCHRNRARQSRCYAIAADDLAPASRPRSAPGTRRSAPTVRELEPTSRPPSFFGRQEMRIRYSLHRAAAISTGWLLVMSVVGCTASATSVGEDTATTTINPCAVGRPATMTISGAPTTLANSVTCGGVSTLQSGLGGVGLFNANYNDVLGVIVAAVPGSYRINAANATSGTLQLHYGVGNQTGLCLLGATPPSGTVIVTSITTSDNLRVGKVQGSFSNVTLCDTFGVLTYTVSGTFKVQ